MAGVTADAVPEPSVDDEHSPGRPAPGPAAIRPRATLVAAGELLRALSAPVRIAIVLQLRDSGRCVHELVDSLAISQSLASQHLRVLRAAGLVSTERRGREIAYSLSDGHVAHIVNDAIIHAQERTNS